MGYRSSVRFGAVVMVVAGACTFGSTVQPVTDGAIDVAEAPPWLAGFAYRKPIAIQRPGTQALQDFPLGIVLASDADLAAHARADGTDIVLTAADATTRLDVELVAFSASGALELWARVPTLPAGASTLYVYYGGAPADTDPAAVFPTARFKGVWHLSDANAGAAVDSTPAHHTLTSAGAAVPASSPGIAGTGRVHDGVDDALAIADPADGSLDVGTASFSYSAWIRSTGTVADFDQPFYKGGTSTAFPGYCLMTGNYNPWIGKLHDGTSFVEIPLTQTTTTGQWLHLAIVVDRAAGQGRGYVNGVMTSAVDVTLGSLATPRELSLGVGSGGAKYRGMIDETRIYTGALTADWIATEHANLAVPGFLTPGAEQARP